MQAKITFTKDFMDKTKYKDLTYRQRGRIWLDRFLELEAEGKNIFAKREELGHAVGIMDNARAYGWAANLVRRGFLKEVLVSRDDGTSAIKFVSTSKVKLYGKRKSRKITQLKQAELDLSKPAVKVQVVKPTFTIKYGNAEVIANSAEEAVLIMKLLNA